MKHKAIRCPKGPARIYLLGVIEYVFILVGNIVIENIFQHPEQKPVLTVIYTVSLIATNFFMCRVLYSKRYDNMLIAAVATTVLPFIIFMFKDLSPAVISNILSYILFLTFTYITIKMPDTPLREKCVKFRFIIPLAFVIDIIISTIISLADLRDKMLQTSTAPDSTVTFATVFVPSILIAVSSIIPVMGYIMLTNWLSDPYEKETNKPKKKDGR